jgi:hypothetical protein
VVALLALRLVVPIVVAPLVAARLSRALGARVQVGDVGFAPLDAIVILRAVTVETPGASAGDSPAIVADRVRIDVQWLPLLHRVLLVRELAFESARIDVARLAGGGSELEVFAAADPTSELPPGWTFALDRIVLRDTRLRVRDAVAAEPIELAVRDARISTLPRRATAFGRAPNLRIDAAVDGGRVRIDGSSDVTDEGLVIDARVRARDVPLARLPSYVPDLGWSGVAGRVSGRLRYQRAPGRRDVLAGRLLGRAIAVHVPSLDEPALAIGKAVVDVGAIDLRARRVGIETLTLQGATLAARADLVMPIPLFEGIRRPAPVAVSRGRGRPPEPDAGPTAWRWKIGRFTTLSARVRVIGPDGPVVLAASISGESLGPEAYWSPLHASVRGGEGVATFDGTARMTRGFTIDGRLTAADVDLPALARAAGMPWSDLAQAGRGAADLSLAIVADAADGPALGVEGNATLTDLWLAAPDANAFAIGAGAVSLQIAKSIPERDDDRRRESPDLRISNATVTAPYVLLTRTPEGWLVPPADRTAVDSIVVHGVSTRGGRLLIVDQVAYPAAALDVAVRDGWAGALRLPALAVGDFMLTGSDRRLGPLQLVGIDGVQGKRLEISGQSVPLAAAGPYLARAGLPYRFQGGTGAFLARVSYGATGWTADTTLTLREPIPAGDEAAQQESLGMPVEAALAALRDPNGDATLHLALASQRDGVARGFPDVAGAVRDAVARSGQSPIPDGPFQIVFPAGGTELAGNGARQVASIAEILASRRDLVVELAAPLSTDDRRWLAARALDDDADDRGGGFMAILRAFGMRGVRERIRQAFEGRSEGGAGRLDAGDEATLAEIVAKRRSLDSERVAALRNARVTSVANELAERYDIAPARIVVGDAGPEERSAPPAVRGKIIVDPRGSWRSGPWAAVQRRRRRRRRPTRPTRRRRRRVQADEVGAAC